MSFRRLLSSSSSTHDVYDSDCGIDAYGALADAGHSEHSDDHGHDDAFNHIYFVMLFIASLWFAGKLFVKLKMPALVGEIVFGIILGPHLLNLPGDEGSDFLIVIGEIGLVMLVVEAGIDVDVGLLKLIGPPALGVAIMGSIFPMSFGFCISYLGMGQDLGTSIAAGACFAPTSMGIALNVLKKAKILNTPTGQLIIAAAILDDVIALMILSELGAMKDPTAAAILVPLIVSPVLILLFGYLAIRWVPKWIKFIMNKLPKEQQGNAILGLLFLATFVMVPTCHFLGSSHLLGAFLAGLMFCTDHTIHHVWEEQVKRVLAWMLRVFFAATIGFAIPIRDFTSSAVLSRGFIYCICGIGKVITGYFARPLTKREFFTVGFSMSAWGEFAFILATASFAEGTLDQETFSAVLLAVLLSVIISPYALSFNIMFFEKRKQKKMDEHLEQYEGTNLHPVYFAINSKSRGSWGHQDKILHRIFGLQLEIIDFRSWHAPEYNHSHHQPLTKESFYVQDMALALPPTKHLDAYEKEALLDRVKLIRAQLKEAMGENAVINIKRWLPGVTKKDDELEPTDNYIQAMFGGAIAHTPKHQKSAEYCRREAFKQAHSIMSVFERKATLEDLRRRSTRSLHGSQAPSYQNSSGKDGDNESSLTFSEEEEKQRKTKSYDGKETRPLPPKPTMEQTSSHPVKSNDNELKKRQNQHKRGDAHTGAGFIGTGAGGAGAVPVNDKTINIHSHWEDESLDGHNKNKEESQVSYIYGDEDSQHHKLPEYSVDNLPDYAMEIFQPRLPQLDEDQDDEQDVEEMKMQMERDMKAITQGHITKGGAINNAEAREETSVSDDDYHKNEKDETEKLVGGGDSDGDNDNDKDKNRMELQTDDDEEDGVQVRESKSKLNKLTIKIYPPAMKSVPSQSPKTPQGYLD